MHRLALHPFSVGPGPVFRETSANAPLVRVGTESAPSVRSGEKDGVKPKRALMLCFRDGCLLAFPLGSISFSFL